MQRESGRYVVIGASGILAPLGRSLTSLGVRTTGISRGDRLRAGAWDERLALDTQDVGSVASWVADPGGAVATVVAYSPAVAPAVWPLLAALAENLVVVATTSWAAPGSPAPPWAGSGAVVVQLGWAQEPAGSRWHTAREVSDAVAAVLEGLVVNGSTPRSTVLGSVRPWGDRPGPPRHGRAGIIRA